MKTIPTELTKTHTAVNVLSMNAAEKRGLAHKSRTHRLLGPHKQAEGWSVLALSNGRWKLPDDLFRAFLEHYVSDLPRPSAMDDRAISMRTLVSAKVMGNRAILYENFTAREGDDEGDRAISMRTSESAKVMGDRAYHYENFRAREGDDEGDQAISMRTLESAKVMTRATDLSR